MAAIVLVMVAVLVAVQPGEAALSCTVINRLRPCVAYLTNRGPLQNACCVGVRSLNALARTTPDRQAVCRCLKSVARSKSGINFTRAAALPKQCGVNLLARITPSIDCSRVR